MASSRTQTPLRDTVSSGFVIGMVAGIEFQKTLRDLLLDHAQIAKDKLNDTAMRVPLAHYTALYRALTEALADEGFSLFSRPLRPGFLEWLVRGAIAAPDLGEALRRICLHINLLQDNLHLVLAPSPEVDVAALAPDEAHTVTLSMTVTRPLPVGPAGFIFAHEWLLRLIHGVSSWLVAQPIHTIEVRFPYSPPPHAGDYSLIFAPRTRFDAPRLEVDLSAQLLSLPVRRDEAALLEFIRATPANITMLYRREQTLAPRVRQLLRDALPDFLPLSQTAQALALSPRSLHRRLEEEGSSYRQLRESVRHELALNWLSRSETPITQIANNLGFADSTSFYRAFASREGCGPREWRRRLCAATLPQAD